MRRVCGVLTILTLLLTACGKTPEPVAGQAATQGPPVTVKAETKEVAKEAPKDQPKAAPTGKELDAEDPHPAVKQEAKADAKDTKDYTTTPSGLKYKDVKVGTGPSPSPGKKVKVHYTGTLDNGSKFDSSRDRGQPFDFTIGQGQVIKGWDEGVMSMKVGGRRDLVIPSDLGYGAGGMPPKIPGGATLHFDVELLGVE